MPGNISLGVATTYSGGVVAAALAGAVDTAATTSIADSNGNIANIVPIRDALTHDSVTSSGFEVFGLIQAASTVTDGDAIGAAASENIQISFVYLNASSVVTLAAITGDIEFGLKKAITTENLPAYEVICGNTQPDIVVPAAAATQKVATYIVTTAFVADEIIDLSDGTGATAGITTAGGDYATATLGASGAAFLADNTVEVLENGVEQVKETDAVWDSATTLHFALALDIGDVFYVKFFA